jgi:hypothetical protein
MILPGRSGKLKDAPIPGQAIRASGLSRAALLGVVARGRMRDRVRQHDGELGRRQLRAIDESVLSMILPPRKAICDGLFARLEMRLPSPAQASGAIVLRTRPAPTSGAPTQAARRSYRGARCTRAIRLARKSNLPARFIIAASTVAGLAFCASLLAASISAAAASAAATAGNLLCRESGRRAHERHELWGREGTGVE